MAINWQSSEHVLQQRKITSLWMAVPIKFFITVLGLFFLLSLMRLMEVTRFKQKRGQYNFLSPGVIL
jgi:hypothetical protein